MKRFHAYIEEMTDQSNSFRFPSSVAFIKVIMRKMGNFYDTNSQPYTNQSGFTTPGWDKNEDILNSLESTFERENVKFINARVNKSEYDKYYKYITSGGYYKGYKEIELVIRQKSETLRKYFMKMSKKEFLDPKTNRFLAELIFSYAHEVVHKYQEKQNVEDITIGKDKKDPYDGLLEIQAGAFETIVSKKVTGKHSPSMIIFTKRGNDVKRKFLELVKTIK